MGYIHAHQVFAANMDSSIIINEIPVKGKATEGVLGWNLTWVKGLLVCFSMFLKQAFFNKHTEQYK